ncbi:hypothetical protein [Rhizobium sp. CC-YZS058]|uniref:hypothetical protein n=1 Tax=Rhizobium sp. CC-YZS058 TaxID=3042153 RepID=UPI002B05A397|nr:hypothetical protein [Rhizobium sp. CC-YZS058]MEA3533740.1 hypothetical protein [Rhizobium sp. CC-YZS058]
MDDRFERVCKAAGKKVVNAEYLNDDDRLQLERTLQQFEAFAKSYIDLALPGHHIAIGFYDSLQVNAFATTCDGQDAIGISWGGLQKLRSEFVRAIDYRDQFAWLPSGKELEAVDWLFDCAKYFIFIHELGHIWHGHTSLLQTGRVPAFWFETGPLKGRPLSKIDRQTMEMDADGFAADNLFDFGLEYRPFPGINSQWEQTHGTGATRLLMIAMSLHFTFRIFNKPIDFDPQEQQVHPSPPLRQRMIAGSLIAAALRRNAASEDDAMYIILRGISEAEWLYATINGISPATEAITAAWGNEGHLYQRKLLRRWRVLRPQLDALKRSGELPAIQDIPEDD